MDLLCLYKIPLIYYKTFHNRNIKCSKIEKKEYVYIEIFIQFQNPHACNKVFACLFGIFLLNIDTGRTRALSFSRSSQLLIRLPYFQIFHLPSRALRGSREKYLATSRDGLYGISTDGTEFLLFRGIIRKKSR